MKRLALLLLCPIGASSQVVFHDGGSGGAVCPLSPAQTEKSIESFGKIFSVITQEPRCVNCHGGVNPFIEGVGDPSDPEASRFEHGGGKMDEDTDCSSCHDAMAPKRDGTPSRWRIPPPIFFFVGKDAEALCMQMHDEFREAKDFIAHFEDDDGKDNFVGTAFMGNRGLSREQFPEVPPQRPRVGATQLLNLAKDWVASTGGEFKGDSTLACGCKPLRYAIRLNTKTEVNAGGMRMQSAMVPVDIPITFKDDGTYTGEALVAFKGQGTADACSADYGSSVNIRASGQTVSTANERFMRLELENTAPATNSVSVQCPQVSVSKPNIPGAASPATVLPFDLDGNVGEFQRYKMPAVPNVSSELRVEIVQLP